MIFPIVPRSAFRRIVLQEAWSLIIAYYILFLIRLSIVFALNTYLYTYIYNIDSKTVRLSLRFMRLRKEFSCVALFRPIACHALSSSQGVKGHSEECPAVRCVERSKQILSLISVMLVIVTIVCSRDEIDGPLGKRSHHLSRPWEIVKYNITFAHSNLYRFAWTAACSQNQTPGTTEAEHDATHDYSRLLDITFALWAHPRGHLVLL